MRTWKDDQGLVPPAAGLLFHQHNQQTHFRVHHFTVEEWNGVFPEPPLTIAETQVLQEAHVRLRNEDQFVAATLTLAAPTAPLMLGSEIGLLPVPIDRLAWVQFPETTFVSTPQEGMIIDVEFQPQGACRCYLSRLENGLLHVSSPYFGKNAFRISSIQSLKFDIGDRAFWALEGLAWPRALPVTMRPAFQR